MNTTHTPPTPEQPAPQDASTQANTAKQPRSRSERLWMIVGIGSLSLLLIGGAVATGSFMASANDDRADRVQINTGNGRGADQHDDYDDNHDDLSDSDRQAGSQNSGSQSNGSQSGSSQSTAKPRSIDIDNNGAVPLDDATIAAISKSALAAAGGSGVVTNIENEQGRNKSYVYEVEIERSDRTEVTVYLDASYKSLKVVEDDTWD